MPRGPRIEIAGGLHHVTARTPSGRLLLLDESAPQRYLTLLGAEVRRRRWSLLTYCLMPNHVHLLIETPDADLGAGMKTVHEGFAQDLNQRHGMHGHVFGSRFHNKIVRDDAHLLATLRYVARNPVAARLCRRAEDWAWGAHRALAGLTAPPRFLGVGRALEHFGGSRGGGRAVYTDFVARTDEEVVVDLAADTRPVHWIARAVDEHRIPVGTIVDVTGMGRSTAYGHLRAARRSR